MTTKGTLKQHEYRVQDDMACCWNCKYGLSGWDGDFDCELIELGYPGVDPTGLCTKHEPRDDHAL